jgi:PAS domain S-box-containing protein
MIAHPDQQIGDTPNCVSVAPQFSPEKVGTWLSAILASSMESVIVIDSELRILLLNRETERMFGHAADYLLGKSLDSVLHSHGRDDSRRRIAAIAMSDAGGKRIRVRLDLAAVRGNGEEFRIEATVSQVAMNGEMYLALILHESPPREDAAIGSAPATRELRKLAVSSQQKNEIEKKRFSKELYDDLGQRLSVLRLDLDWLQHQLPATDTVLSDRIAQMQRLLGSAITRTKNIASTLRPPLLDDFGLMPAIEWMVENFQKKTGIACELENRGFAIATDDPAESVIFRVIQESLLNVERHAHASRVRIMLEQRADRTLDIIVADNGIGMAPGDESKPGCYGLTAMQERVYILGGTITRANIEPTGFAIRASLPIDQSPHFLSSL